MRILVTGGTGFIGSNLVLRLMKEGHELLITGSDTEQSIPGFTGTVLRSSFIGLNWKAIGKVDILFHQAAINDTTFEDGKEMMRANVDSAEILFRHVLQHGCRRIVYASSTAVYGNMPPPYREKGRMNPLNCYAESKRLLDNLAMWLADEYRDLVIVGLRYSNVYGPRENHKGRRASMIYQLAQQIVKENPRIFRDGEQKRDFVYVDDVIRANLLAANAGESGIYNCGSGMAATFNEVVKILCKVLGKDRRTEYFDNPFAGSYQNHTECDMTLAREKLGFVPEYDVERGIGAYYESGFLTDEQQS